MSSGWTDWLLKPSIYDMVRNWCGLTPLRGRCSKACWMSDAAWTEWKSYSRPRYNYVAWLPESTPFSIFKSARLGTRSLFNSANTQSEMSSLALKNVQRLRISKSLTCDDLSVRLASSSPTAIKPWINYDFGIGVWKDFDTICWQSCARGNGKQALTGEFRPQPALMWSDENADFVTDIRAFKTEMMRRYREEPLNPYIEPRHPNHFEELG